MAIDTRGMEERMIKYYESKMDEAYLTFHRHPTHIQHYPDGYHTNEGEGYCKGAQPFNGVYRNGTRYSNGVPDKIANRKP